MKCVSSNVSQSRESWVSILLRDMSLGIYDLVPQLGLSRETPKKLNRDTSQDRTCDTRTVVWWIHLTYHTCGEKNYFVPFLPLSPGLLDTPSPSLKKKIFQKTADKEDKVIIQTTRSIHLQRYKDNFIGEGTLGRTSFLYTPWTTIKRVFIRTDKVKTEGGGR